MEPRTRGSALPWLLAPEAEEFIQGGDLFKVVTPQQPAPVPQLLPLSPGTNSQSAIPNLRSSPESVIQPGPPQPSAATPAASDLSDPASSEKLLGARLRHGGHPAPRSRSRGQVGLQLGAGIAGLRVLLGSPGLPEDHREIGSGMGTQQRQQALRMAWLKR
ncbi:hypothetical protein P7K49_024053 [Saguinus oedipus]|uniref:Uncharacterized protein n=1 Tax=Saguinus oedipus TaxID=9490 RepID=A0ABQ9UQT9_SAGOE|nr:hypothetical protein P7K49_024053 [Saguinus oedipus]